MVEGVATQPAEIAIPEDNNPYVGPQPLRLGDPIHGREREVAALRHLLLAERIVLLYSPSGAGKSSLIQAGLIPALGPRFEIWGPTRVNQAPPADVVAPNRYVWSAIQGIEQSLAEQVKQGHAEAGQLRPAEELASMTLNAYVDARLAAATGKTPILIVDQFEEVVRVDPLAVKAIDAFFEQLGEVLVNPRLWALFAIREDYLAPLDEFARRLPTHLQTRYRIDRLRVGPAIDAIVKPTEHTHRKYAPNVVEELVKDLALVKVQQLGGGFVDTPGTHVEPLQLQVVCFDLWERVRTRAQPREISKEDVGNITNALSNYYARSVAAAAKKDERVERRIREWFRDRLITPDGVRNQVRQEGERVGGLELGIVSHLLDSYLVRMEPRANAFWYELSHDRLVNPVRTNNTDWFNKHLNKTQQRALQWDREKEPRALLLVDNDLVSAEQWAAEPDVEPNAVETRFLAACRLEQERVNGERSQAERDRQQAERERQQVERERAAARRQRQLLYGLAGLLVVAGMALWYALAAKHRASASEERALASEGVALANAVDAKWRYWYAESEGFNAKLQQDNAQRESLRADEQAKDAERERRLKASWELGASATDVLSEDPQLGMILALHSLAKADVPATRTALHKALLTPGRTALELGRYAMALAFAGKNIAAFGSDGRVRVWNLESGGSSTVSFDTAPAVNFESFNYTSTYVVSAVSLDSTHVAAATKSGLVYLWETTSDWEKATRRIKQLSMGGGDTVRSMALSPRGDLLAIGTEFGAVRLWKAGDFEPGPDTGISFGPPRNGNQYCASLAFGQDGRTLIAVGAEGRVSRFDIEKRTVDNPGWPATIYVERIAMFPGAHTPIFGSGWGSLSAPIDEEHAHSGRITAMALNRTATLLATGSDDGNAFLWDPRKGVKLQLLSKRLGPLSALAFDREGTRLAVGSGSGSIRIFDLAKTNDTELRSLPNIHNEVSSIAFSADGKTLVTGGSEGITKLWSLVKGRDGPVIPALPIRYAPRVTGLAFNARGDRLATSSWNRYVRVFDFADLSRMDLQKLGPVVTTNALGPVSYGPDGSAVSFGGGGVYLWRPAGGASQALGPEPAQLLTGDASAIFASKANILATASFHSGQVQIWNVTGQPRVVYEFKEKGPILLAVNPAGDRIALTAGGAVKVVRIDLAARTHEELLHFYNVSGAAAFSPDGNTGAFAFFDDGVVELRNVVTGETLITLPGHKRGVTQLAFSRDGKRLASGAKDGSVQVYALDLAELLQIARSRLKRELTADECYEYLHSRSCPSNEAVIREITKGDGQ